MYESLMPAAKHSKGDCRLGERAWRVAMSLLRGLSAGRAALLPVTLRVHGGGGRQGLLGLDSAQST